MPSLAFDKNTGEVNPTTSSLLGALTEKFGLSAALAILRLIDPNSSTASKAFAGARLGGTAAQAAGALSGSPALSSLGKGVGTALGVAGTGYGISQIANDPNLSNKQKAGHSAGEVANLIASLFVPYYGLGVAARALNQWASTSKSPQVSGAAKGASAAALPVEAFMDVLGGDRSPKAALRNAGQQFMANPARSIIGTLDPVSGSIFGALGIGNHTPSHGTTFRKAFQNALSQSSINLKDRDLYREPAGGWQGMDPKAIDAADFLAKQFAGSYPDNDPNFPGGYQGQAKNLLLNNLSPLQLIEFAKKYGGLL